MNDRNQAPRFTALVLMLGIGLPLALLPACEDTPTGTAEPGQPQAIPEVYKTAPPTLGKSKNDAKQDEAPRKQEEES